jgi:hypothetical protein
MRPAVYKCRPTSASISIYCRYPFNYECTSKAQTASMRIASASNLLNAERRSSSCSQATSDLCRSIWRGDFQIHVHLLNCLVLETCGYYIRRQWYCSRWTQEGRSSSIAAAQATAEFVSSDLKRRFSASRTLLIYSVSETCEYYTRR